MENFDLISYYRFLEEYKYVEFVTPDVSGQDRGYGEDWPR